jgi:hypothetical protein
MSTKSGASLIFSAPIHEFASFFSREKKKNGKGDKEMPFEQQLE